MEMELNILFRDLERLKEELLINKSLQDSLRENIDFLKTDGVIVSLSEFKKIKQQKKLVDMRVGYYITKIQPLEQIVDRKEEMVKNEMNVFEQLYRMQFKSNVLEFPDDRRKRA